MKKITVSLLMAGSFLLGFQLHAQTTFLTNGLIAYYPFQGNANDATGNNHNAAVYYAILTNNQFGLPDTAYYFSGAYIEVTNTIGFPASTNDFTVSLWVNFAQLNPGSPGSQFQILFCGRSYDSFQLDINTSSGTNAPIDLFTGATEDNPNDLTTATVAWTLNNWYNLQIIRSQNNLAIYRNAQLIGQTVATHTNAAAGQNLDFGARLSGPGSDFPLAGALTDIRIYNRALSPQEVAQLYEFESGQTTGIVSLPCITFLGVTGALYTIQYSTNLSETNWSVLVSNVVLQPDSYLYTDTNAFGQPQRFYRVIPQ